MRRVLQLDAPEPPQLDRYGFYDGQWVHTPEPVVIAWFGEAMRPMGPDGELQRVTTNCHRIEGTLELGGGWPMVRTTLVHPKGKYDWSPRREVGLPVIFTVRDRLSIAPGRLIQPRALVLEETATGCTPALRPPTLRLE